MPDPQDPVVNPNQDEAADQAVNEVLRRRETALRASTWGAGDKGAADRARAVGDVAARLQLPPAVVDLNLEALAGRAQFQAVPFQQLAKENPRLAQVYLDQRWAAQVRQHGPGFVQAHKIIDDAIADIMRRNEPEIDQTQPIGVLAGFGAGARSAVNRLGSWGWAIPALLQQSIRSTSDPNGDPYATEPPTWSPLGQFWNLRRMQDAEDWNRRQMRQGFVSAVAEAGGQFAADPTAVILPLAGGMAVAQATGRTMQIAGRTTFQGAEAGFAPAALRVDGQLAAGADVAKKSLDAAAIVGGQLAAVQAAAQSVEARRARGEDARLMSWGELTNAGAQAAVAHLSTVYGGFLADLRLLDQTRRITSGNLAGDLAGSMAVNAGSSVASESMQSVTDRGEMLSGQDLAVSAVSSAAFGAALSAGTLATAGEHNARLRYLQATDVVRSLSQVGAMKAAADHAVAMGQSRADVRTLMQSGLPANLASVHLPTDALQALATARSVSMDELIADLGLDPKTVAEAQALGHEVSVPTVALIDGVSSAELQTLGDRIRFSRTGATMSEVRDEVQAIMATRRRAQDEAAANERLAEAADDEATRQLVAEAAGSVSGPTGDEATVRAAYRAQWIEQLVAAGESQAAAEAAADLWVSRQDARAKRLSLPFEQVAQFNPVSVSRQGAPILDSPLNTVGRALAIERNRRAAEVRQMEERRIAAIKAKDEQAAAAEQARNDRLQGKEGDDLIADARTRLAQAHAGQAKPLAQGSSDALRALGPDFGIAPDAAAAQAMAPAAKQRLDDLKHALSLRGQSFKTLFEDAWRDSQSTAAGQQPGAWQTARLTAQSAKRGPAASESTANAARDLLIVSRALNDPRARSAMPDDIRTEYEAKARRLAEQIMPELDKQLSDMDPGEAQDLVRAMHDAGQDVGARALAQGPEQVDATGNRGTFDPANPSILHQGGLVEYREIPVADVPKTKGATYRGIGSSGEGAGTFRYGKGLYSTRSKKLAQEFTRNNGKIIGIVGGMPDNPLRLRSPDDLTDWLLKESGETRLSTFNEKFPDPGEFIKSKGYDGVIAGDYIVKYPQDRLTLNQPAYHGTGNSAVYDRFRYDRVGGAGGEGAQAYGWGLYFAGKKEVGKYYREALTKGQITYDGGKFDPSNPKHRAALALRDANGDRRKAIDAMGQKGDRGDAIATAAEGVLKQNGEAVIRDAEGRLYTVDIPEDSEMLDWDAPLKDQPEHVKKAIDSLFKKNRDERFLDAVKAYDAGDTKAMKAAGFNIFDYPGSTGALYKRASEITAEDRRMDEQRSQKAVSDFLRANGVPGIRYLDQMSRGADGGSRNYVIFDDSRIAIQAYEQPGAAPIGEPWRGRIIHDPRTRSARIELAAKRDASTFAHESFHHWLFEMLLDADRPEANQQMRDDARLTLRKLGVTDQLMEGKTFTDLLDGLTVDQHEKWAGWGETYLRTAKAPSKDLATTFSRFRSWIGRVWRGLMAKGIQPEDIDAEVSGIMDRLLATDDAIQAANANDEAMRLQALADSPIRKLLAENPEQAALAAKLADDAKREQSDAMAERAAAESRREQTEAWRADMEREREVAAAEVDAQPVYQAIAKIAAKDLPADQRAMRLEPGAVRALLGEAHAFANKKLLNNAMTSLRGKQVLAPNGGGVHPDAIAEAMGYPSGVELVIALAGARPRQQLIDAVAAERMRQKHGDLKTDPALAEEAGRRAINNSRARLIQLEMSALTRKSRQPGAPVPTVEVVRRYARDQIAGRAVYSIEPALYRRAMDKAAREAFLAAGEARWDDARAAKHRELVNHELLRAAEQAVEASKKGRDYLAKFESSSVRERIIKAGGGSWSVTWTEGGAQQTKVVGTIEEARQVAAASRDPNAAFAEVGGYMEQIEGVLDGFSLRRASKKRLALRDQLRRFVEYRQELGDPIDIPEGVVADLGSKRWDELTPLQQKEAVEAIEQIDNLARINGKLLAAHRQASYEDAKAELLASIEANAPRNADQSRTANTPGEKMGAMMGDFMGAHVKDSFLARELDGYQDGGAAWDLLIRPRNDAANREAVMIAAVAKERAEQMAAWGKKATAVIDPDLKLRGKALTNEERIAVALNYGNAEGRQRLLYLADNDQEMLDRIIKSLDAADRTLVEATWRLVDRHWSEIQALEKRTRGVQPIKVDAVPYQVGSVTMTGGYYPISYGSDNAPARGLGAFDEATGKLQGVATGRATTRAGSVQTRAKTVNKDIKLDFGVVAEHLRETIHDITHREVVRDQVKILNDPEIQQAIRQKLGIRGLKQLADTVRYMAQGDKQDNDGLSKAVRFLRRNGTGATFAFNLSSALLNITGFANSLTRLGPVEMAVGAKHFVGIDGQERSLAGIHRRSEFMRTRHQTWMREVAEAHRLGAAGLRDRMWLIGYWPMAKVQQLVDGITWAAAYEKALRGGAAESDAVAVSDQTVRDTQGSGQLQDLAGVQRGGELKKAFTTFYSYFGATYQLQREGVLRAAYRGRGDDWMALGSATLLATFVPALLGAMLGQALRGDDVLDDPEQLAKKLALEQIGYTAGYLVLVRDIVGPAVSGFGWEGPAGTRGVGAMGDAIDGLFSGDINAKDAKRAITAAGFLTGLPATEINRAVDAWMLAGERGDYADAARILLFGKPRQP